jgi:hypothetical protein
MGNRPESLFRQGRRRRRRRRRRHGILKLGAGIAQSVYSLG